MPLDVKGIGRFKSSSFSKYKGIKGKTSGYGSTMRDENEGKLEGKKAPFFKYPSILQEIIREETTKESSDSKDTETKETATRESTSQGATDENISG